jgi:thiamine biosynthesis lipoprotein
MGSAAHMLIGDAPDGVDDWAMQELERLEQCWSRFRSESELCRLNATPGGWVDVSTSMLLALQCAHELHTATGGIFDPTVIDALERAGYDRTFELVGDSDESAPPGAAAPGFAAVEIDDDRSRARLPIGTRIDLGGLGKGLAADLLARGLVDRGARSALVNLGGDVRARGETPEHGCRVPVEDPRDDSAVFVHTDLDDDAIVTSTTRLRAWTRAGERHHHLIDPARGKSAASGISAVVARAPDAWWAEGIAKAMLIGGRTRARELAHATGVAAWLFYDNGAVEAVP